MYDAAGRLTSETESVNGTVTQNYAYTYDASGNRLTLTASGNEAYSVAYTYDKANRLLTEAKTVSGVATVKTYTYDLNGNLLTVSEGGAITESYTYDPFGKMLSYTKSGTTTAYTYRPDGMLYTKQTGNNASTKKTYISSDGQIVFEQTGTDNVGAVVYSYGLTRISAKSRTSLTAQQGIRYYYLYNAHGDVVRIISGTNVTVKTYDYDAFGNDRSAVAGDTNPFRYCGEYFDTATETYFLRARWYDPATGRFTQQDAWAYYDVNDPLSLNLYVYCSANPVMRIDPSGTSWRDFIAGLALALDTNTFGGIAQLVASGFYSTEVIYHYENEEHYYLGRTIGSAGSLAFGVFEVVGGIKTIKTAIESGSLLTVGTGGGGAAVAVPAASAAVAVGIAEISAGVVTYSKAANSFGNNLGKYIDANNSRKSFEKYGRSIKTLRSNKEANGFVEQFGYSNAEQFKKAIVGDEGAQFNIGYDTKTKEVVLIPVKKGGSVCPTGYYID